MPSLDGLLWVERLATRPHVRAGKFGAWLQLQRRGRSFEQVALQLRPLVRECGLKVDRSTIKKIENGQVPSWPLLLALATVYDVPVEETLRELVSGLEFPGHDLVRHASGVNDGTETGGPAVDTAQARLLRELDAARETIRQMHAAAETIGAEVAAQLSAAESFTAGKPQPRGGKGRRRAG